MTSEVSPPPASAGLHPGGTHKGPVERLLLTIRSHLGTAINAVDALSAVQQLSRSATGADDAETALRELKICEELVRSLEQDIGGERLKNRPWSRRRDADLITDCNHDAETRNWLVNTFTSADVVAADSHHQISLAAAKPLRLGRVTTAFVELVTHTVSMPDVHERLDNAGSFGFDALAFATQSEVEGKAIVVFGVNFLRTSKLPATLESSELLSVSAPDFERALVRFFSKLDALYRPDAVYHGVAHAIDVMSTVEWMMRSSFMKAQTTAVDYFMIIVAAAIHDAGHPGKNNLYLSKTMDPLAIRYNDRSILENMHVSISFETMKNDSECDWFQMLARPADGDGGGSNQQQYVRKGLVDIVLATDMANHAKNVQELTDLVSEIKANDGSATQDGSDAQKVQQLEKKLLLLETALHAADISNPCKPRPIMLAWTKRVLDEFWAQGDEEAKAGLQISPLCDRSTGANTVPRGQIGFISFVVQPYFKAVAELVAEMHEACDQLADNKTFWEEQDKEKVTYTQLYGGGYANVETSEGV